MGHRGGVRVDSVVCIESAVHHHWKILLLVPTMLQIWGILSILRSIDTFILFSNVSGRFPPRTLLLLRSVQVVAC